jgi:hypothetical protein
MNPLTLIKGDTIVGDGNETELSEDNDQKRADIEMWVAKTLGTELHKYYPTRNFSVGCDLEAEAVIIKCPEISQEGGYFISMKRSMQEMTEMMMRVGGEILERGGVATTRKHDMDDLEALPRDFNDRVLLPDVETPEQLWNRRRKTALARQAGAEIMGVKNG